jgi:hypothetical protein
MSAYARTAWRLGAVAAVAATGLLLAASTAGARTAASTAAAVPECSAADLGVWVAANQGNGAAGTLYVPLEFTNLSTKTCTLDGFPGVSALSQSGAQLGSPASWDDAVAPSKVTLAAGATAYATLGYSDVVTGNCPAADKVTAAWLLVYPPGQTQGDRTFFDLATCTAAGQTDFLRVRVIAPGPGTINSTG